MPKRILQGVVVSKPGNKTVKVRVSRRMMHPRYKKIVTRFKSYAAHDEDNKFNVGDTISIRESRPLSRTKRWEAVVA